MLLPNLALGEAQGAPHEARSGPLDTCLRDAAEALARTQMLLSLSCFLPVLAGVLAGWRQQDVQPPNSLVLAPRVTGLTPTIIPLDALASHTGIICLKD